MLGIIGGTGLTELEALSVNSTQEVDTPYGKPSAPLLFATLNGYDAVFLARHGNPHKIPPHKVNYRANLRALADAGVKNIIAVAAVGGIASNAKPAELVIPDQIIDYTYGRKMTFFEDEADDVVHVDFSFPYCKKLGELIKHSADAQGVAVQMGGTYGATQGPRLETAAEINRMERDGCDLVGMTGMPEAVLARELGMNYACISVVGNWAAGKVDEEITMEEVFANVHVGMGHVAKILANLAIDQI